MTRTFKLGSWVRVKPEFFKAQDIIPYKLVYGIVIDIYPTQSCTMLIIKRRDSNLGCINPTWHVPFVYCEKLPGNKPKREQKLFLLQLEAV
jgi:hypothetical protein